MPSVLMVAYHFPPEANAGSLRPLRYVKELPTRGWQPTVLTLQADCFERYDPALLSAVPGTVKVIRIKNLDPWQKLLGARRRQRERLSAEFPETAKRILAAHHNSLRSSLRELVRNTEAWAYHPDIAMGWIRPAVNGALKACKTERPNVIWATAGPVSSFIVAQRIASSSGIPYVLDFRDAWTLTYNEFEDRRPQWAKHRDWRNMFALLKGANAVVFRYETEAECYWRAYEGSLEPSKIHIIPNGYDGSVEPFTPSSAGKCKILYTGTLPDYRYDTLLQALCVFKKNFPSEASRVQFHFIGEGVGSLENQASDLALDDLISVSGPVGQDVVARMSREADALLLLGRPPTMRGHELFAAAKLFGYLKAGRPIFGVLPDDEAKKILLRLAVSTIADVDCVPKIIKVLRHVVHKWAAGELESLLPNREACKDYSSERQADALVRALDGRPAHHPFVPGSVDVPASLKAAIRMRRRILREEASAGLRIANFSH